MYFIKSYHNYFSYSHSFSLVLPCKSAAIIYLPYFPSIYEPCWRFNELNTHIHTIKWILFIALHLFFLYFSLFVGIFFCKNTRQIKDSHVVNDKMHRYMRRYSFYMSRVLMYTNTSMFIRIYVYVFWLRCTLILTVFISCTLS